MVPMSGAWRIMLHNALHSPPVITWGAMAKRRNAEVLEYILMNLRLLSLKAQEADLGSLTYMLEVAAMEAEHQLTNVFPSPKLQR